MKKRLFITTGNFSLLNVLTLIEMNKEKCEDFLIIFSGSLPEKFISANKKMAALGNFKKIEILHDWTETKFNFSDFDEVYSRSGIKIDHPNLMWFDEGFSNIYDAFCYPNLPKKTFYWKYLNKLLPTNLKINQEPDKKIFTNICSKIENLDTNKPVIPKGTKTALITAQYVLNYFYTTEEKIMYYERIISDLQSKGFSVYLKHHPREELEPYLKLKEKFKTNFHLFDSYFPLEVYQLDFTVMISCACNALFTMPYLKNIPTACALPKWWKKTGERLGIADLCYFTYTKEYIPDYKDFLKDITADISTEQAKNILNQRFEKYLSSKSDTNHDSKIQAVFRLKRVESQHIQNWNKTLGKILACFCPLKRYRKKIRRIEFFKSIQIMKGK